MNVVGNRGGRKKILWARLLKLSLIILPLSTALSTAAFVAIAHRWNPMAPYLGLAGGAVIVLVILIDNLLTPIFRLPYVK